MEKKVLREIFGETGEKFVILLEDYFEKEEKSYKFTSLDSLIKTIQNDNIPKSMNIYWNEILLRSHASAYLGILRQYEWIQGIYSSYLNKNYLSFCANYRGLLESSADITDALGIVAKDLAIHIDIVDEAINNKLNQICLSEIEKILIHFQFARKLSKGESEYFDSNHNTKYISKYLDIFKNQGNEIVHECYKELCQIVHPSFYSTAIYFKESDSDGFIISKDVNLNLFSSFLAKYENKLIKFIFMLSLNSCFTILKILNILNKEEIYTKFIEKINLDAIPIWKEANTNYLNYKKGIYDSKLINKA